ncbi:MAG: hypothetical protein J5I50_05655 [Chitinophagaceae bacterium]|nr:hypothetical protein [Chitinophagaceae bacterium]
MGLKYRDIKPLLRSKRHFSAWVGTLGLAVGLIVLLMAVQMFVNIQDLLNKKAPKESRSYDYVSVTKTITNENMGKDNSFSGSDITRLKEMGAIEEVAPVTSNKFKATVSAGSALPFSSEAFLESVNTAFLDTLPANFSWVPGQKDVPVIISSEFLEMYNVFAPSQGLPQLSEKTISSVHFFLECTGPVASQTFRGTVVGLTDRINSVLVPESFLEWGNKYLAGDTVTRTARTIIKVKDANNPELLKYLAENDLHINKDKVRFGRIKGILEGVVAAMGIFGLLVVLLALVLFGFYLQLAIAKSKDNIRLLLLLGYSPKWLAKSFTRRYLPLYFLVFLVATAVVMVAQYIFSKLSIAQGVLSPYPDIIVGITLVVLLLLILLLNSRMVRKEIQRMG